jgi:hypothetical protein
MLEYFTYGQNEWPEPLHHIAVAREILSTYYDIRVRSAHWERSLTIDLIREILELERNELRFLIIDFCLRKWGAVDWDLVASVNEVSHSTVAEVFGRIAAAYKGASFVTFEAEFVASVILVNDDLLLGELLRQ